VLGCRLYHQTILFCHQKLSWHGRNCHAALLLEKMTGGQSRHFPICSLFSNDVFIYMFWIFGFVWDSFALHRFDSSILPYWKIVQLWNVWWIKYNNIDTFTWIRKILLKHIFLFFIVLLSTITIWVSDFNRISFLYSYVVPVWHFPIHHFCTNVVPDGACKIPSKVQTLQFYGADCCLLIFSVFCVPTHCT
jgi:hypothetical protein